MDNFTFESEDRGTKLETYEWDNIWLEQATDQSRPRVLYIGDSISCGIRQTATRCINSKILFDGLGTSKAVDNPFFTELIHLFGKQQRVRDMVIFNNGLHGFHLSDDGQYKNYYEKMIKFLMEEFGDSVIVLVLTTDVAGSRKERVITRNEAVEELALKYQLPIIDLYSASKRYVGLRCEDGVHYTAEGYKKLAEHILESIYEIMPSIQNKAFSEIFVNV